ncbi:MAG: efflux RND transporter periplasmic adaptor subunit [Halomonas sp.]|uniref:efflux RND transporter periplasmic adaptor subunit n=1 Tax=Halomonas sp. TaxID=1486246 RepID=UPI0019E32986|nr:efflux RND transporter periplasmic adaptor subunit [Halomonas sp.]MBE0489429.1 efflux RND transporter periplasmic adaptor subunit [Halomonas sp.]
MTLKAVILTLAWGVVAVLVAGSWWLFDGDARHVAQANVDAPPAALPVRIDTAAETPTLAGRRFVGRLEPASTVDIAFQITGQILDILPDEGERVPAGSLLARLDPEDFELALARAESNLTLTRSEFARASELVSRGVTPPAQLDRPQAELTQARISVDESRRALDQTNIHAPFEAMLARRLAEPYANVTPAVPVLRLQDVSRLYASISLPEELAQAVRNMPDDFDAVVYFAALPGLAVPLSLGRFVTEADPVAQTYEVKLLLTESDPRLLPGMTATVEVRPRIPQSAVTVPMGAIDATSSPTPSVWVIGADDRVTRQPVQLGLPLGDRVVVLEGLVAGDRVVAAGWRQLTPGDVVRPASF